MALIAGSFVCEVTIGQDRKDSLLFRKEDRRKNHNGVYSKEGRLFSPKWCLINSTTSARFRTDRPTARGPGGEV